jgi:hypothetical protein
VQLFGRRVVLELGTAGGSGRAITDLRVTFSVTMTNSSTPNKAKIELYNAGPWSLAAMQAADAVVRLSVGYESDGGVVRQIFQGNPITNGVKSERKGADRVLTIDAHDGGREYTTRHVSESYTTATTSGQLFAALADAMGLPLGNVDGVVSTVSFPHGLALTGRVSDQLDRVAALSGAMWGIHDGTIQVWPIGGSTGEQAVVFSATNGNLIGSPAPTKKGGVEVTALIAPTLRPGMRFRVVSADLTGDYVATDVEFKGDNGFSTDFYVVAKGKTA